MSKIKKIEEIIFEVLSDGKCHSLTELRNVIMERDETLLQNRNYLNVILSRLKNEKNEITSEGKEIYRMLVTNEKEIKDDEVSKEKILIGWKTYYESIIKAPSPNYDMSEEEFRKGKWMYELNKKIEKVIIDFPEYEKEC